MSYRRLMDPKFLIITPLVFLLMALAACGGTTAEPIVVEKEVIKEIVKEVPVVKEVIKEVPKEVIVEKEVVREVVKEVFVIPTSTPRPVTKGDIPGEGESPVRGGTSARLRTGVYGLISRDVVYQLAVLAPRCPVAPRPNWIP